VPSLDGLHLIARAVTPPRFARRFDTRFLAADARGISRIVPDVAGPDAELVALRWLTLEEARGESLADITRTILDLFSVRLAAGLERDLPVPYLRERAGRFVRQEL
jgi:hypothetical protein